MWVKRLNIFRTVVFKVLTFVGNPVHVHVKLYRTRAHAHYPYVLNKKSLIESLN